jgi:deoxyadenosine/deoxycytidine kinase
MPKMPKQKCITTYIDADLDSEIERICKRQRTFKWVIINDALRDMLKKRVPENEQI